MDKEEKQEILNQIEMGVFKRKTRNNAVSVFYWSCIDKGMSIEDTLTDAEFKFDLKRRQIRNLLKP